MPRDVSPNTAVLKLLKASILYKMQDWKEAEKICTTLLTDYDVMNRNIFDETFREEHKNLLQLSKVRIAEIQDAQCLGKNIPHSCIKDGKPCKIGSYTSNVIIKDDGHMGRGLFLTRDVKNIEPTLVLLETAFAYASGKANGVKTVHVTFDLSLNGPAKEYGESLSRKTMTALQNMGPQQRSEFFKLYSGRETKPKVPTKKNSMIVDGQPVFDA